MMPARVITLRVAKEAHVLLPLWLGCLAGLVCLAGMGATTELGDGGAHALGMFIFGGASVTLGALSIGHEYTHRTLAQLLSQPVPRARLFLVKQSVLAVMLLVLAAAAWGTVVYPTRVTSMIVPLAVLCGLGLAPLLTMVTRNPLAGIVFTMSIPGMVWLPIDWFVAEPLKLAVFWRAMVALCTIAGVLGWRTFIRLEAKEGRGPHVHMEWSSADAVAVPARRRHPIWWLAKKELRVQQMTFVLFAIYLLGSLKLFGHVSEVVADVHGALTGLYSGILALLIGSLGSAEEREHGTLESQLLLPIASSTQWMVKAGVALGLALVLAVGVPALLIASRGRALRINEWYVCGILILTVTGLYISSLSSTGLRALLLSVLATLFVIPVFTLISAGHRHLTALPAVLLAGLLFVALWFGFENHRSADRSARRTGRQILVMTGCLALAGVVLAVL